jgi:hypothetical protein
MKNYFIKFAAAKKSKTMEIINKIQTDSYSKAIFALFYVVFFNFPQHISGFFSLASIKKPSMILINKTFQRVALLTKTQNGMQR